MTIEPNKRAAPKPPEDASMAELVRDVDEVRHDLRQGDATEGDVDHILERCRAMIAENAGLRAKLAERNANAERYLWLRANAESRDIEPSETCLIVPVTFDDGWQQQTDDAIDAARQSAQAASQPSNPETTAEKPELTSPTPNEKR